MRVLARLGLVDEVSPEQHADAVTDNLQRDIDQTLGALKEQTEVFKEKSDAFTSSVDVRRLELEQLLTDVLEGRSKGRKLQ